MTKIIIKNDLFDIAERLKSVNPNYVLVYNTEKSQYEVYDKSRGDALAFTVPYSELDARTVDFARFTAVQNAQVALAEIERHNAELEICQRVRLRNNLLAAAEDALRE